MKVKSLLTQYFQGEQVYNYGGQVPPILFPDAPSPTPSITASPTPTPSITPTLTRTPTPTPSITPTITRTQTPTPTPSISPSQTATPTITPTITRTPTLTPTPTITQSPFAVCPEEVILNGNTLLAELDGTYQRVYSYTGGSFNYGVVSSVGFGYDLVVGSYGGNNYPVFVSTDTTAPYNPVSLAFNTDDNAWVLLDGNITTTNQLFGLASPFSSTTISIGGVLFPSSGLKDELFNVGTPYVYVSYPPTCPTPTPTPSITATITPTTTRTPTPTRTSTQTPTPTPTPSATPAPAPPLLANMALWYDATDASTITTANFSGVSRVISFVSKGYSALTLSNSYSTIPLQAPRYIPSLTYPGKNTITFSGETGLAADRQRLVNTLVATGATANISVPNGITQIVVCKNGAGINAGRSAYFGYALQSGFTTGRVVVKAQDGQINYLGTDLSNKFLSVGGQDLVMYQPTLSAYNGNELIVFIQNNSTGICKATINYQQLEADSVLATAAPNIINAVYLGGRYSFGTTFTALGGGGAEFYEMLVYDKPLSVIELEDVYAYIDAKYSYDNNFVSSAWTSNDILVSGFTDYAIGSSVNFNNVAFGVNPSIVGNNNTVFPAANRSNAVNYQRKQNTFDGRSKWYLPIYLPSAPLNTYGIVSQKPYVNDYDVNYGVRSNIFVSPISLNISGCSYADQTNNTLTPGISYSITATTNTDCGYTSATTWNTYIDYNSSKSGSNLQLQFNSFTGFTNVFYTGVSTSNGIAYSGQQEQKQTNFLNLNNSTAFTETIEIWECDVDGNDIENILTITGSPARFYNESGVQNTNQINWFAQNHFKIKYIAI